MPDITLAAACEVNPPPLRIAALPDSTPVLFVPMAAVDETRGEVVGGEYRKLGELRDKSYRTFSSGDVLLAKITPSMENGKAAVVPKIPSGIGFGSTEFHVLRPRPGVLPRFIWYFVRQVSFRRAAAEHFSGSVGQLRVPPTFVRDYPLDLPLPEVQAQIVAILDSVTDRSSTSLEHLAAARNALNGVRRSILASACYGRLTADWRLGRDLPAVSSVLAELRARPATRNRCAPPRVDELEPIPESWAWASVGEVAEVRLGGTPARNEKSYWDGGIPWVSSGEVANCRINDTRETISESGLASSSAKLYPIGTVLIAMIGEGKTRGQAAILDIEASTNQNVAGLLVDRTVVLPEYLWRWALAQYEVTRAAGRGGNQPALNGQKVRELTIPVPTIDEQREIVARVDRLLTTSAVLQERVDSAERIVEHLTHSVLDRVFRGEISPNGVGAGPEKPAKAEQDPSRVRGVV